ncbi:MAG TPA: cyclodeaminase/cyclohydrolase family protein [Gaiellaceae bacterium]
MTLLELRLSEFLDEVSGTAPTPAGGSLAAFVTAAAAGLLAKVAKASKPEWGEAAGIAAQAESLRDRSAPLAQIDADEYRAALRSVVDAGDQPGERRDFAVGNAYARAAEPPLRIVEAATDVAELAVLVAEKGNPNLRADAVAAGILAAAAASAAAELVAVNLTATDGDARVVRARTMAGFAARAAEEATAGGREPWE